MLTYRWSWLVGCPFFCLWFHYFSVYWFQGPTPTLDLLSRLSLTKWRITRPLLPLLESHRVHKTNIYSWKRQLTVPSKKLYFLPINSSFSLYCLSEFMPISLLIMSLCSNKHRNLMNEGRMICSTRLILWFCGVSLGKIMQ